MHERLIYGEDAWYIAQTSGFQLDSAPSSNWPEEEINILSTPADVEIGIAVHLPEVACVQQDRPTKKRIAG